ncbi:hypothetical protein PBI_REDNO2_99 [Mycobacterium phage Redno2]|uniref:hypothetical protein n=1 Tax=Mycobacterium phage Redno2 TaxID=1340709 RepID=UPI000387A7C8|nr:hypothetical protein N860_gp099 [Mycobacterium phage Redno2]AGS82398.1 hypothetical protein PBI_REDNO2_99 [Mycobacterium phage Redno2]
MNRWKVRKEDGTWKIYEHDSWWDSEYEFDQAILWAHRFAVSAFVMDGGLGDCR